MQRQKILDLKPTQFAVGMLEVDEKIREVRGYGNKKRREYVDENPIPVVISPQNELYIVDHHHFLCVCYQFGIKKVRVKVVDDFSRSKMSYSRFWKRMYKSRQAYPFCQFGEGPREALYLPRDIRGLADDPYRSIAWFVRKSGGYENTDRNFAEFKWANFFRERRLLEKSGLRGLSEALVKAAKLAQTPAAKRLPGYEALTPKEKRKVIKKLTERAASLKI
jgi:hypothetical protein